jgi:hypothetical protein
MYAKEGDCEVSISLVPPLKQTPEVATSTVLMVPSLHVATILCKLSPCDVHTSSFRKHHLFVPLS